MMSKQMCGPRGHKTRFVFVLTWVWRWGWEGAIQEGFLKESDPLGVRV